MINQQVAYLHLRSLQASPHGEVRVSYHRLEPGTFVAFTPQSKDFQKALQAAHVDLEALLQATLMQHTALSEGDWIAVNVPSLEVAPGMHACPHLSTPAGCGGIICWSAPPAAMLATMHAQRFSVGGGNPTSGHAAEYLGIESAGCVLDRCPA